MALLKKIIKNDPREVIVKWTGSGSDTLTLASLVGTGQTVTGVPFVTINGVVASISTAGVCTVTRNSQVTLSLHDNFYLGQDGNTHIIFDENGGSDIVVNLASDGTLILKLKKIQGYSGV